jgi:hypothetical protein
MIENAIINHYKPSEKYSNEYELKLDEETLFPPTEVISSPNVYEFETFRRIIYESDQIPKLVDVGGIIRKINPTAIYTHQDGENRRSSEYRKVDIEDETGLGLALFFWNDPDPVIETWYVELQPRKYRDFNKFLCV